VIGYDWSFLTCEEAHFVAKTRRRHANAEQFWRDTIAAWKESGQSIRAFCAARGVAEATFFVKRRKLAGQDQPQRPAVATVPSPSFAAVRVIRPSSNPSVAGRTNTLRRSSAHQIPDGHRSSPRGCCWTLASHPASLEYYYPSLAAAILFSRAATAAPLHWPESPVW
jgi:hypothetical protein